MEVTVTYTCKYIWMSHNSKEVLFHSRSKFFMCVPNNAKIDGNLLNQFLASKERVGHLAANTKHKILQPAPLLARKRLSGYFVLYIRKGKNQKALVTIAAILSKHRILMHATIGMGIENVLKSS